MEVVLEDQVLYVDSMEEVISDENPLKKLLKKEQRLATKLQEEREAEARAQDRYQRAKARLQRRKKRLERIQHKLSLVREQLVEFQTTDQFTVYRENELVIVPTPESTTLVDSEEVTLIQPEQHNVVAQEQEPDDLLPTHTEFSTPDISVQDQESTSIRMDVSDVATFDGDEEMANEQEFSLPSQETTSPNPFSYEPIEAIVEPELEITPEERSDVEHFAQQENTAPISLTAMHLESIPESEISSSFQAEDATSNTSTSEHEVAQELEVSSPSSIEPSIPSTQEQEPVATVDSIAVEAEAEIMDSSDSSSETNAECKPTKPLQLEQQGPSAASSYSSDLQSAKEAWIAGESAMQNIRNAANGLATSISFLSQTDGLSNEFMEELVRKQADANRELLKAEDAARAAYERFVQVQRDSQSVASQSINTSEGSSQQNEEDASVPPAEDNGLDQTVKLHAIRLYSEW